MEIGAIVLQLTLSGMTVGAIYGIVGLGFTIIYNATSAINFAQGEFVMLGGMIAVSLVAAHVPLYIVLPLTGLLVAGVGVLLERFAIRPVSNRPAFALISVTIGASVVLQGIARLIWGPDTQSLPAFSGETPIAVGPAALSPQEIWVAGMGLLIVLAVEIFFRTTVVGKAMRACAIDRTAAKLAGINVDRMNMLAFALSAGISGIAGVVLTPLTMMSYASGGSLAVKGFCAAIVGGLGNGVGAVIGGVLIGVLEALGAGFISSGYKNAFAFLVLLLVLFLRPGGIFGRKSAKGL